MLLIAPKLGESNLANGKTIRTVLPKLKNKRKYHADIVGGRLKHVRVLRNKEGYVIQYRNKNPKWYYQSTVPLNQKVTEKALTKYVQGKPYWKKEIEFQMKRELSYSAGYAFGRFFRPLGEFLRGIKIGYDKARNEDNKSLESNSDQSRRD